MIQLRPYQKDIIFQTINSNQSTLIQIPTGGGKTVIAKEIIGDLVAKKDLQVLFVAPKIILMEQTAKVFKGLNPHIIHGTREYNRNHSVLISTIQTATRRDLEPDVIIVDEIHYGFEGKMLKKLIKDKPNTRVIGLSATPYDKNGEQLSGFNLVLDKYDMKYMVENNYLVDIKAYKLTKVKNLDKVNITAGDYNLKELSKIVCNNQTILEIVLSTKEYILRYKKAIVFAVDINHAELLTKAYRHEGLDAKVLHSEMPKGEVSREIRLFKEGQTKILVSVLMLTTGFDVPDADVAVIARPTKSQNLYKQMVGRVLRPAKGKIYAVLLDCGNVINNLGLPLEPIKVMEVQENNNPMNCQVCHANNITLKNINKNKFWVCNDCNNKVAIEQGTYKCKYCAKRHTHRGNIDMFDDKLFLHCLQCGRKTLISEYVGNEQFIRVNERLGKPKDKEFSVKSLEQEGKVFLLEKKMCAYLFAHLDYDVINYSDDKLSSYVYSEKNQKRIQEYKNILLYKMCSVSEMQDVWNLFDTDNFMEKTINYIRVKQHEIKNIENTLRDSALPNFINELTKRLRASVYSTITQLDCSLDSYISSDEYITKIKMNEAYKYSALLILDS